jgi:hypothetical protein
MLQFHDEVYVDPNDHLENLVFARRMRSHLDAIELQHLADYARANADELFAYLEVATRLHISDRAAQRRMAFAVALTERLPRTLETLRDGRIEEYKAQLICEAVAPLTDEQALQVEELVLGKAAEQTAAQLRYALSKAVLRVDPLGAEERRLDRLRDRRVESRPTEDGQAVLSLHHAADRIAAIQASISAQARQLKALGGEQRTLAQLEADIMADLLLGVDARSRVVEVHLTLPATTALGLDHQPGEFDGMPITAGAARELLAEATRWRWIKTDPKTGAVADVTYPQYSPPAALATLVKVRDRTCRFAGCMRRARGCDIDHRTPWPLGATCDANCVCLCRRHHRAKHEGGWQLQRSPAGWCRWTSPAGTTHVVDPEPIAPLPTPDDPPPY